MKAGTVGLVFSGKCQSKKLLELPFNIASYFVTVSLDDKLNDHKSRINIKDIGYYFQAPKKFI